MRIVKTIEEFIMRFYLSGGMEFKEDLGTGWRKWVTKELEKKRHEAVDPVRLETPDDAGLPIQSKLTELKLAHKLDEVRKIVRQYLIRKDMFGIQLADALLVCYDHSVQKGAGTLSEAWESFREGKPIYVVTDFDVADIPTWLIGETTQIFYDLDEFLEYVDDHSNVIRDMMQARRVRDTVLGGIY